jgi:hypothetical protein
MGSNITDLWIQPAGVQCLTPTDGLFLLINSFTAFSELTEFIKYRHSPVHLQIHMIHLQFVLPSYFTATPKSTVTDPSLKLSLVPWFNHL